MNNKSALSEAIAPPEAWAQSGYPSEESYIYEMIYGTFARNPGVFELQPYGEAA